MARAVSNVLWNSDIFTVSSEVTLPSVDDSSVSDSSGDPSLDELLGTTVWRAVLKGACKWRGLCCTPSGSSKVYEKKRKKSSAKFNGSF